MGTLQLALALALAVRPRLVGERVDDGPLSGWARHVTRQSPVLRLRPSNCPAPPYSVLYCCTWNYYYFLLLPTCLFRSLPALLCRFRVVGFIAKDMVYEIA
jgi:hypothetical protein